LNEGKDFLSDFANDLFMLLSWSVLRRILGNLIFWKRALRVYRSYSCINLKKFANCVNKGISQDRIYQSVDNLRHWILYTSEYKGW